jgi:protein SHQ1
LITLLFSYAYESRTTQHDPTPESAWTICSLTPAFSALDPPPYFAGDYMSAAKDKNNTKPNSVEGIANNQAEWSPSEITSTLIPSYRRSLAFPLHRSFPLAEKCREDVARFLSKGRRTVFRCLLEVKDILDHHEVYYVYSKIWLDDFCVWIQAYGR